MILFFWAMTPCYLVSCFEILDIEIEGHAFVFFGKVGNPLPVPNYVPLRTRKIFRCAFMKTSRLA